MNYFVPIVFGSSRFFMEEVASGFGRVRINGNFKETDRLSSP